MALSEMGYKESFGNQSQERIASKRAGAIGQGEEDEKG
jgi:hypothetical protein